MMHGHEKSDSVIVAVKPANKVVRCWHSNAYSSLFFSLFFFDFHRTNFSRFRRTFHSFDPVGFAIFAIFVAVCIISQNVFSLLASAPTAWNTLTWASTCGLAASAGVVTRNSVMAAARARIVLSP